MASETYYYVIFVGPAGGPLLDGLQFWKSAGQAAQWGYESYGDGYPHVAPLKPGFGTTQPLGGNTQILDAGGFQALFQGLVLGQLQPGATGTAISAGGLAFDWAAQQVSMAAGRPVPYPGAAVRPAARR